MSIAFIIPIFTHPLSQFTTPLMILLPEEVVVSPQDSVSMVELDGTHDSRTVYKCPAKR